MKTNLQPRFSLLAAGLAAFTRLPTFRAFRKGTSLAKTTSAKTIAVGLRTGCAREFLPLVLMLLAAPAAVQAQYTYTTNNGRICRLAVVISSIDGNRLDFA
jgi:hypothetical protein